MISCLISAGCTTTNVSGKKDYERRLEYTRVLLPNHKNHVRYFSAKSEQEGIEDLRRLIPYAEREEAYTNDGNTWTEIGYNEKTKMKGGIIERDSIELSDEIMKEKAFFSDTISVWHIHRAKENKGDENSVYKIALVSPTDIYHFMELRHTLNKVNENVRIKDGVISVYGDCWLTSNNNDFIFPKFGWILEDDYHKLVLKDLLSCFKDLKEKNSDLTKEFEKDLLKGEITLHFKPAKK